MFAQNSHNSQTRRSTMITTRLTTTRFRTKSLVATRFLLKSPSRSDKQTAMQNGSDRAAAKALRYIDLFCGIGGFRQAMENLSRETGIASQCVFSSDIDKHCRASYAANFGHTPGGDIKQVHESDVPKHDLL